MKIAASLLAFGLLLQPALAGAAPNTMPLRFEENLNRSTVIKGHENARFSLIDRMAHYRVPGVSITVIKGCKIVDSRGFGQSKIGGRPVDRNTQFQAASLSKTLTAVAALRLVEEGRLSLDDDVRPHLKRWQLPQSPYLTDSPITLRRLLNHTAGTSPASFPGYAPGAPQPTLDQILDGVPPANTPALQINDVPGANWNYSGGGYLVAQELMTETTGESFPTLMEKLVLRPIGMVHSRFGLPISGDDVASGTAADGSPLPGRWHNYPELAAAGLWTTSADMARFLIALGKLSKGESTRFLGHSSAAELMTRGPGDWGLGVDLGPAGATRQISHTGANLGFQSAYLLYTDACDGAVVMTNADDPGALIHEIMRAIGETYSWPDRETAEVQAALPTTDSIAKRFVGRWQLRDFPSEHFSISLKPDGTLYWAREGHVGRDLLVNSPKILFSPDSGMIVEATEMQAETASALQLKLGSNSNIAVRF